MSQNPANARLARSILPFVAIAALTAAGCGGATPSPSGGTPSPGGGTVTPAAACGLDLGTAEPDATIFGASAGDFLADRFSLATGDFNGDGTDDVLVGAPLADGPNDERRDAGEAYVVFGGRELAGTIDLAKETPGLAVRGGAIGGNMGFTVASGDVNGDDFDDVIVGARFAAPDPATQADHGEVYVIFGGKDLRGTVDIDSGQQDVTLVGARSGDFLGIALAAGDINGDGLDDLIMGASDADGPGNTRAGAGAISVVLGAEDLPSLIDLGREDAYLTVWGGSPDDHVPNYLSSGDLDGDGDSELLVGAPAAGTAPAEERPRGEAYVVGLSGVPKGEVDLATVEGFTRLRGAKQLDGFGFYVTAADLNADGLDDAIIGARDADGGSDARNNAGEAHVLFGREDLPAFMDMAEAPLDVTLIGADLNDSLGHTLASGDLNGDGTADLLVGAPLADGCQNRAPEAGEAFAILGRRDWNQTIDLASGGYDVRVSGRDSEDSLGFSLASGDLNGDGKDDIVAGALTADGPDNSRPDAGEAYVILSR